MRHITSILLLAVGLAACGTADAQRAPANEWGLHLDETTDFQRDLLGDGELTFAEYERAALATVQCLRDAGVNVSGFEFDGRQFAFVFGGSATPEGQADAEGTYDGCYAEYQSFVDIAWTIDNQPSEQEAQAIRDEIGECLRQLGADVPDHPTQPDIAAAVDTVAPEGYDCLQTY